MTVFSFQIIFAEECTEAEGRSWHLHHFACFQCDQSLGGLRYVMRDDRPYCLQCFETQFADPCSTCHRPIAVDDARMSHGRQQWHASNACFACATCQKPLLGKPFLPKEDEGVFCGVDCLQRSDPHRPSPSTVAKQPASGTRLSTHVRMDKLKLEQLWNEDVDDDDEEDSEEEEDDADLENQSRHSDYETISPKLYRSRKDTDDHPMARSVIDHSPRKSTQAHGGNGLSNRASYRRSSLPDLSLDEIVVMAPPPDTVRPKAPRPMTYRPPGVMETAPGQQAPGRFRVDGGGSESSYKKACNNSVITTLIVAKKETTFGVETSPKNSSAATTTASTTSPDSPTCPRRTVRFLGESSENVGADDEVVQHHHHHRHHHSHHRHHGGVRHHTRHWRCSSDGRGAQSDTEHGSFRRRVRAVDPAQLEGAGACSSCSSACSSSSSSSSDSEDDDDPALGYYTLPGRQRQSQQNMSRFRMPAEQATTNAGLSSGDTRRYKNHRNKQSQKISKARASNCIVS